MASEKRVHPRYRVGGLQALIIVEDAGGQPFRLTGEVVDISYTGIKIRLNVPLTRINGRRVKIELVLPETGIPLTISGTIKHWVSPAEFGLHYADALPDVFKDHLLFECTKSAAARAPGGSPQAGNDALVTAIPKTP